MKKFWILMMFVIIAFVFIISGCGTKNRYVGTWVHSSMGESSVVFFPNHTGEAGGFLFGQGSTFDWHEEGDHAVIENWSGPSKVVCDKAVVTANSMRISGPHVFEYFNKEKEN